MEGERQLWYEVFRGREPRADPELHVEDDPPLDDYDVRSLVLWLPVSFVYVAAIILQVWGRPSWDWWLNGFDWLMSALFAADWAIRFKICKDRKKFAKRIWNIADLVVIATPALGYFLPKGASGLARAFRIYRLCAIAKRVWDKGGNRVFEAGQVKWVGVIAAAVIFLATLTVWVQEIQHPDGSIKAPLDAVWWAVVTMFTVGYGDAYPHSGVGKVAAFFVMFAGIALFSWATGALASRFVSSESVVEATKQRDRMERKLSNLTWHMEEMQRTIVALSNGSDGPDGHGPQLPGIGESANPKAEDVSRAEDLA